MSRWFRHYAGMVRDDKLVRAALRAKQTVERVVWVWGAILESAAEMNDGGRYEVDTAEIAYFLRSDEDHIRAILDALTDLDRLAAGRVVHWGTRQFHSDNSATRQAAYRERKRKANSDGDDQQTSGDGDVTSLSRHGDAPETETETERKKEVLSELGSDARKRITYPEDFEGFWRAYPTDANMSKKEAFDVWKRLPPEDKAMAVASIPNFKAFCAKDPTYRPIHACRYLAKRRFEGHGPGELDPEATAKREDFMRSRGYVWSETAGKYVQETAA